jgi:hypothetical protein
MTRGRAKPDVNHKPDGGEEGWQHRAYVFTATVAIMRGFLMVSHSRVNYCRAWHRR